MDSRQLNDVNPALTQISNKTFTQIQIQIQIQTKYKYNINDAGGQLSPKSILGKTRELLFTEKNQTRPSSKHQREMSDASISETNKVIRKQESNLIMWTPAVLQFLNLLTLGLQRRLRDKQKYKQISITACETNNRTLEGVFPNHNQ